MADAIEQHVEIAEASWEERFRKWIRDYPSLAHGVGADLAVKEIDTLRQFLRRMARMHERMQSHLVRQQELLAAHAERNRRLFEAGPGPGQQDQQRLFLEEVAASVRDRQQAEAGPSNAG